jgi:methionyl-tRNA synthetase
MNDEHNRWGVLNVRKIIVTSALIYANGEVHLGHVTSTYLPADIFVRFCRLNGYQVVHVSATDDFGTPISIEANKKGVKPEDFVAFWNKKDREDFADLGISFDIFDQTSSEENRKLTQHFFKKLDENGYIYEQDVLQPFCESCNRFLPDRYIKGTCPFDDCGATEQYSDSCEVCGRPIEPGVIKTPHCAICGSKPITRLSKHYFFKLSEFSDPLKKWLKQNQNLQHDVKNYVLNWIDEGLRDWDITRNLSWGIPVPSIDNRDKVLYVWFNNHLGYISTAQKLFAEKGDEDGRKTWNGSEIFHFIGKDIVYHHYLYLPAMRMGVNEYKLPDYIPTRGYFTLQGRKFSKSREWYISVRDFLTRFPADYLRFYLAIITPYSQTDVNFDWQDFENRINNELIANVGNFVHRVLTFTWSQYKGQVPEPSSLDDLDKELKEELVNVVKEVAVEINQIELSKGLRRILAFSAFCNKYFQTKAPWKRREARNTTLYLCVNAVRSLAILLEPYIPFSAQKIWQQLNLKGNVSKQTWVSAQELKVTKGHKIVEPQTLFVRVQDAEKQ